jgi:hypothetical protein
MLAVKEILCTLAWAYIQIDLQRLAHMDIQGELNWTSFFFRDLRWRDHLGARFTSVGT